MCIEKYRLNSLGHPVLVRREDREPTLWFQWAWDEAAQTGCYEASTKPEWAEGISGWL